MTAISAANDQAQRTGLPSAIVTSTNSLAAQYVDECEKVPGLSYTRVMGAKHYLCAHSAGAIADTDFEDPQEWLQRHLPAKGNPATQYELANAVLPWGADRTKYACPGQPSEGPKCEGKSRGGCGARLARARAFQVEVVLTNYALKLVDTLFFPYTVYTADGDEIEITLLPQFGFQVFDEGHTVPDQVYSFMTSVVSWKSIYRFFDSASKRLKNDPTGLEDFKVAILQMMRPVTKVKWSKAPWDTDRAVTVNPGAANRVIEAYELLPEASQQKLSVPLPEEDPEGSPAVFIARLQAAIKKLPESATWTTRSDDKRTQRLTPTLSLYMANPKSPETIVPQMCSAPTVFMSATLGPSLPERCGLSLAPKGTPGPKRVDLPEVFDWSKVEVRVSSHFGRKPRKDPRYRKNDEALFNVRAKELANRIDLHRGSLVLCSAFDEIEPLRKQLAAHLPTHEIVVQQKDGGGSLSAQRSRNEHAAYVREGKRSVLIGTKSCIVGMDLPGELCTLVAWWRCAMPAFGTLDDAIDEAYPTKNQFDSYKYEQFRTTFVQGVGRLLRRASDTGEIVICDSRGDDHLSTVVGNSQKANRVGSGLDEHLRKMRRKQL